MECEAEVWCQIVWLVKEIYGINTFYVSTNTIINAGAV